jgi:hypothetical protein
VSIKPFEVAPGSKILISHKQQQQQQKQQQQYDERAVLRGNYCTALQSCTAKDLGKSQNSVKAAERTECKATTWQLHDIIN